MRPRRSAYGHMSQNIRLAWLDVNIDEINNNDCRNAIAQLRRIVNNVNLFTNASECVDYIRNNKEEKVFVIFSGALGQTTVPIVHNMSQLSAIYIFCQNEIYHKQWARQWSKVKGVFTEIACICELLRQATEECDQDYVSMSFIATSNGDFGQNLDQLDQSFMYTQILKEIILTIDFKQKHINDFIKYCREQFVENAIELVHIKKFEKEYDHRRAIWWYTFDCFLYSMLNRALRTMEVDLIIKLGFLIRDIHQHIGRRHSKQYARKNHLIPFTVYRGQGLSQTDFNQLMKTEGGLISFNQFLSTSKNRDVSLDFLPQNSPDLVSILFVMRIDPSISSTPFADICDINNYPEEEILFSMHSVFRINQIKSIDGQNRFWQVDLTLTSDTDAHLQTLTEHMRQETFPHLKGWHRLAELLIKLGHFNMAEHACQVMLEQTPIECEKADIYHTLGMAKTNLGQHADAITFYEKSIKIKQQYPLTADLTFAHTYGSLGSVFHNMGEYYKGTLLLPKSS